MGQSELQLNKTHRQDRHAPRGAVAHHGQPGLGLAARRGQKQLGPPCDRAAMRMVGQQTANHSLDRVGADRTHRIASGG